MSLRAGVSSVWAGKVSSFQMSSRTKLSPLWARKHLCGRVGLYRPRQRKRNVCVGYDSGKKTSTWTSQPKWATSEARKCLCGRVSLLGMHQRCRRVRVSSLGVKINISHLSVPLFREPLRSRLENSTRNRR